MAEERLELLGIPAVILVAERHDIGVGRAEPQGSLEVAVEVELFRMLSQDEPRIVEQCLHGTQQVVRRVVVRNDADPVLVGLRLDRGDLRGEEIQGRMMGRHADRDPPTRTRPRDIERRRAVSGQDGQAADRPFENIPVPGHETQTQVDLGLGRQGRERYDDVEPAEEGVAARIVVGPGFEDIGARLRMILDRVPDVAHEEIQEADPAAGGMTPPLQKQCRAEARTDRDGQVLDCPMDRLRRCRLHFLDTVEEVGQGIATVLVRFGVQGEVAPRIEGGIGVAAFDDAPSQVILDGPPTAAPTLGIGPSVPARRHEAGLGQPPGLPPQRPGIGRFGIGRGVRGPEQAEQGRIDDQPDIPGRGLTQPRKGSPGILDRARAHIGFRHRDWMILIGPMVRSVFRRRRVGRGGHPKAPVRHAKEKRLCPW